MKDNVIPKRLRGHERTTRLFICGSLIIFGNRLWYLIVYQLQYMTLHISFVTIILQYEYIAIDKHQIKS